MPETGEANGVVVVTGAAGGIGAAVAAAFAAQSTAVALLDNDARVHEVRTAIAAEYPGVRLYSATVDVTDPAAVDRAFDAAIAELGRLTVVVHAAGVLHTGPVAELTAAQWDRVFGVNATGTVNVTRRATAELVDAGGGALVVVTSNAAGTPRAGMAAYAASKAAAAAFARSLGLEVAAHGVRVNLVSPGSTDTPMLRGMSLGDQTGTATQLSESAKQELFAGAPERFRLGIPLRRVAQPADVADAVLFLASPAARHITLHDLRVDGGATLDM